MNKADQEISVIAPSLYPAERYSEAEVLGSMLYLWNKDSYYRQISVESMMDLVVPIIKHKQFIMFFKDNEPVGYFVYAYFDEELEQEYLENNFLTEKYIQAKTGRQLWFLSIFSPSGYSKQMIDIAKQKLFPSSHAKSLYHRGKDKGLKVLNFYGAEYLNQ